MADRGRGGSAPKFEWRRRAEGLLNLIQLLYLDARTEPPRDPILRQNKV